VFRDRKYQEIAGVILILFSVILLISLFTYNSADYRLIADHSPVYNLIGPLGSLFSHLLRSAFGIAAYFFPLMFGIAGWCVVRKGRIMPEIERIFSIFFVAVSAACLISLFSRAEFQFSGGYVGLYIYRFFRIILGDVGSYLVIIIMNLIGLILLGMVSITSILDNAGKEGSMLNRFKSFFSNIKDSNSSEGPPLNTIGDELDGKKKRMPWIVKRRIIIYETEEPVVKRSDQLKYLEMSVPLASSDRAENSFKESFTHDSFYVSDSLDLHDEILPNEENTISERNTDPESESGRIEDKEDKEDNETIDIIPPYTEEIEDEVFCPGAGIINSEDNIPDAIALSESKPDDMKHNNEIIGNIQNSEKIECNRFTGIAFEEDLNVCPQTRDSGESSTGISTYENTRTEESPDNCSDPIPINNEYIIPTSFLESSVPIDLESCKQEIEKNSKLLVHTLADFGIESKVINVNRGPVITLYELQIAAGIKVNKIVGLSDDIAMALAALRVRIIAPIPGKSAIGVEIPNKIRETVTLGDIITSEEYKSRKGNLKVALGKDVLGKPVTLDLKKQPHLLIAGATGSGKSVCVNSLITSIIYNYEPDYVKFIMVDPKMVELQLYNGIPHLLTPVITDPQIAPRALKWAIYEMERRYQLLSDLNTRDIERYNQKVSAEKGRHEKLPYIITIIDELADLMMVSSKEIEGLITRIAQKARAVGIHLVLATQRPSVDIITGIIKANFPARIAFQVAQKTDSRTILDQNGAEKLLGQGDMLYQSPVSSFPVRMQGAYVSEDEILKIIEHLGKIGHPEYIDFEAVIEEAEAEREYNDGGDELFVEALKIVENTKKASASFLQRKLSIGYNRAARIIELMEDRGYIGPQHGSKPREVFI